MIFAGLAPKLYAPILTLPRRVCEEGWKGLPTHVIFLVMPGWRNGRRGGLMIFEHTGAGNACVNGVKVGETLTVNELMATPS